MSHTVHGIGVCITRFAQYKHNIHFTYPKKQQSHGHFMCIPQIHWIFSQVHLQIRQNTSAIWLPNSHLSIAWPEDELIQINFDILMYDLPCCRPVLTPWVEFHVLRDYVKQLRLKLERLVICKFYGFHPCFFFSASIIPSSFICKQMGQKLHASHVGRFGPFGPPKKTRLVDLHQRFDFTSTGSMT